MFSLTPAEVAALELSLRVGLWSTAASLPFGILVAWVLARCEFPGKTLFNGVVHLPLVLQHVVVGYGLLVLFGRHGAIGAWLYDVFGVTIAFTWRGAAIAAGVIAFPLLVRAIRLSIEAVDRRLESAARTLGAAPRDVFVSVTLPLIAPGILTGVILGFIRGLGEFGATITFVSNIPGQTQTLPLALYSFTQTPGGDAGAIRLAVISVVLALAALVASEIAARRLNRHLGGSLHA